LPSLRRLWDGVARAVAVGVTRIFIDPAFDLRPEVPQQALHRPGGAIARMMSVDLSITITAAVPSADLTAASPSKSIFRSPH
jgi:hypothetical protein